MRKQPAVPAWSGANTPQALTPLSFPGLHVYTPATTHVPCSFAAAQAETAVTASAQAPSQVLSPCDPSPLMAPGEGQSILEQNPEAKTLELGPTPQTRRVHTFLHWVLKLLLVAQGAEGVFLLPDDPVQDDPWQHRGHVGLLGLLLHSHTAVNDLVGTWGTRGVSQRGQPCPLPTQL